MKYQAPEVFNIAEYFLDRRIEEGKGDRVALRTESGDLKYREVQGLANQFANALVQMGIERGDRVFLAMPDSAEFVGALFGVLKVGAVVVMVNPNLKLEALSQLVEYCRPRGAVIGSNLIETSTAAADAASSPIRFLTVGERSGEHLSFEVIKDELSERVECVETRRDDPAIWLFSGGTTGRPKAVVQTHQSFANTTELYAKAALGFREDDVTLSVPKLYFGYATGSNLLFPFSVGASAILFPEHPTPEVLFEKIGRYRPTILINVPTMINQMVVHPDSAAQDLSCLRFATSAGEALPIPLYERWKELYGVELLDGLGTAEMWHIFVSNLPGDVQPGTLGKVVPGFELKVCDETGVEVGAGEVGRLWVKGDSLARGYWEDEEKTRAAFQGEWFVGGDLVRRDEEGYLTYCGRSDDVLKVGGKWLAPQEVENCLMNHPAVAECAVVGVENESGLVKPYAFVVSEHQRADLEQELKDFVLQRLQPYKHPRRVVVLDDFPRTHLGKVDRGKLKELV
jgi:benzoate-CoA ligase family protein